MTTRRGSANIAQVTGVAAGVPYVARPPATGAPDTAPIVVAWHLMDPPRTEAALAAALPLDGLEAWRVYLGLPMSGSRMPSGGPEELMRLGYEDAVLNIQGPVTDQAASEFVPALRELRDRLELRSDRVGVMGGSIGAAVAQLVLLEGDAEIVGGVLVSPLVRLRQAVEDMGRAFGIDYAWTDRSLEVAERLDFVARADEFAARGEPPILVVVGEEDEAGFREAATDLRDTLAQRYADPSRVDLATVPGMGHALAEEPGLEPAPQTSQAAEVDRLATDWLRRCLAVA